MLNFFYDLLERLGIVRWIRPPDPTLNVRGKQIKELLLQFDMKEDSILDLGSGGRRIEEFVYSFDIQEEGHIDIVGDAHLLPFKNSVFKLIICTALLEHVIDPKDVVREIKRCLAVDGIVYVQVPFLEGYHGDPHDYYRFTIEGIEELFSNFILIEKGVCIGPISVLVWYFRKFLTIFFVNKPLNKAIEFITGWLLFPLKFLDYIFIRARNAHIISGGVYYIGKKRNLSR